MGFIVFLFLWLEVESAAGESLNPESPDLLGPVEGRGEDTTLEALAEKGNYIALYFSAGWCEPCGFFTPQLALAHEAALEKGHSLAVVVVSNSKSPEESDDHFDEMPESWWRLPYHQRSRAANLASLIGASSIPAVSIFSPTLELVNRAAREQISEDTEAMEFPWRPVHGESQREDETLENQRRTQTKHSSDSSEAANQASCMWRQTGGCVASGPREPKMDKFCSEEIEIGNSGFCDCNGNGILDKHEPGYGCDDIPGNCDEACQDSRSRDDLSLDSSAPEIPNDESCAARGELTMEEFASFEIERKPLDDPTAITTIRALAQEGKFIAIYFAAIWCEACMQFEPKLSLAAGAARTAGKSFETIFISHDKSFEECDEHFQDMPEHWWRLPYTQGEREGPISQKFNIEGIPTVVILSPALEVLNLKANELIEDDPMAIDFPWKKSAVGDVAAVVGELPNQNTESYSSSDFEEAVLQGAGAGNNDQEDTLWDMQKLSPQQLGAHEIENWAGEQTTIQSLTSQGSFVGIYFAAQHCAFCSQFSPELATMQEDLAETGNSLEIVFVSSDHEGACDDHFKELPETWWRLPCNSCEYRKDAAMIAFTFDCNSVPQLALISPDLEIVHSNVVSYVMGDPMGERFPWKNEGQPTEQIDEAGTDYVEPPAADSAATLSQIGALEVEGKPLDDPSATTTIRALAQSGKFVGIYFSAGWCDACDDATQQLAETTALLHQAGNRLAVVFVSNDKSEGECDEYFIDMPESWWRLPFPQRDNARILASKFDVTAIPVLAILSPELEVVNENAMRNVLEDPMAYDFPWPSFEYTLQQDKLERSSKDARQLEGESEDTGPKSRTDESRDEQEHVQTEDDMDMMDDVR